MTIYQATASATPGLAGRLADDPYAIRVVARLQDFFSESTPWSRRLWDIGSILALREAHEVGQWVRLRVLSPGAVSWFLHSLEVQLGGDRGVGEPRLRKEIGKLLRSGLASGSFERLRLEQLLEAADEGYLRGWRECWQQMPPPSAEHLARAVAAHLLDKGFSPARLQAWVRGLRSESAATLGELLVEGEKLAGAALRSFEVLVPFTAVPRQEDLAQACPEWLSASEVAEWFVREHVTSPPRQGGGFRYLIEARDAIAAAQRAGVFVHRMQARASYARGLHARLIPQKEIWIAGEAKPLALKTPNRGAELPALVFGQAIYAASDQDRLDSVLEFAAMLNTGPPAPAVTGAWSAIEALLFQPGDPGEEKLGRAVAGDRIALLATCSWPRAELTTLGYRQVADERDELSRMLTEARTNRERCEVVAAAIAGGRRMELRTRSDKAAELRVAALLASPIEQLGGMRRVFERAMRRLYRLRNIMVHGGSTDSVAFEAGLRIAAPIVGAGLDRMVNARFASGISGLQLAARAENSLALLGDTFGPKVTGLLD